jgi:ribosomal protein S18 acetylase RimI-like enzyme
MNPYSYPAKMPKIQVMPFEQGMEDEVVAIHNQAFEEWRRLGRAYQYHQVTSQDIADWLKEDDLWVAYVESEPAGYVLCGVEGEKGRTTFDYFLYRNTHKDMGQAKIAVVLCYRRKGVATALLNTTLHYFSEQGLEIAVAFTYSDNHAATGLLSKLGFIHKDKYYLNRFSSEHPFVFDSVYAELDLTRSLVEIPLNSAVIARSPCESDLEVMIRVFGECSPWVYGPYPDPRKVLAWLRKPWGEVTLVAEFNGKPVGAMEFSKQGLLGIPGVLPEYRPIGVGTTLFYRLLEKMKNQGYRKAVIDTGVTQREPIRMYERFGFDTSRRQWSWVKLLQEKC